MASFSTPSAAAFSLSKEQAHAIVEKHITTQVKPVVWQVTEMDSMGYRCVLCPDVCLLINFSCHFSSYSSSARTYVVDLAPSAHNSPSASCFVVLKSPTVPGPLDSYFPNALPVVHKLLSQIHSNTDIPIADPILDTTHTLLPYDILFCPPSPITSGNIVSLAAARKSGLLTAQDAALVDLQIGAFFGQLHSRVQNDWFGAPQLAEPPDPSYSWQETFAVLLETLLAELEAAGAALPYVDIRRHLARAIAFFLFDDVEVPSLVWLTGSEDDVYIALPSHPATKSHGIAAILPNAAHALWGDPLLESFFLPPAPSAAVLEGYIGSGGAPLIVFPRQKTKRIWYSLFLGLLTLKERRSSPVEMDQQPALDLIQKSVEALADAPLY